MYNITMITAMDWDRVIGKDGQIPWRLSDDMKYFSQTTTDNVVVMGRKTYDSLPRQFKPLPRRENVILTRNGELFLPGCTVVSHIETVLKMSLLREVFIIGGAELYKLFLPYAKRLLVTQVETRIMGGDTFFPAFTGSWSVRTILQQKADARNQFGFFITEYTRIVP